MTLQRAYTEGLEAALAQVIADARRERAVFIAETRADMAQLQAQLATAKAEVSDLKAALTEHVDAKVARAVEALPEREEVDWWPHIEATVKAIVPAIADRADSLEARIKAVEDRPAPEPVDMTPFATKDELLEASLTLRSAIPQPVEMPDLSGFATLDDLLMVRHQIPQMPEPVDLSPYATLEAVEEVRAAIPAPPEPVDLSGLARREEVEAIRAAIPEPVEVDLSGLATREDVEAVRAAIPEPIEMPNLDAFATHEDVEAVRHMIPAVPEPKDWTPEIEAVGEFLNRQLGDMAEDVRQQIERFASRPGKIGEIRVWADEGVSYHNDIVSHDGAIWQAQRDTGKAPGHDDWVCIVQKGEQGINGRSMVHRGTYDPVAGYFALDAVTLNGSTFLAVKDNPGDCPGDGWQLMASRGSRGAPGLPGEPGKSIKGDPGAEVAAFYIDAEKDAAVIVLSNGATHEASLYDWGLKVAQ